MLREKSLASHASCNDWNRGTIDWSNEAISSPSERLDEDGFLCRFAQRIA
jgi:hypothetical protein